MDKIDNVVVTEMTQSNFVRPFRLRFNQNNIPKAWDLVQVHESVAVIIFNTSRNVLILVKQFRPAVYYNGLSKEQRASKTVDSEAHPGSRGVTLEVCAGIVDKHDLSLEEIAKEEILEECGYDVPVASLEKVITFRSGIGIAGEKMTLFYVEVTDTMRVNAGGGNAAEGEFIEVVELTVPQIRDYVGQPEVTSPGEFLLAMYWFLANKAPKL